MPPSLPDPSARGAPAAEQTIELELVRGLLCDQHPDLASFAVEPVAEGWDNAIFRLGADLALRLPRRLAAAQLIETEQRWLPSLAAELPVPIPAPIRIGHPGRGYPWRWSVIPWLKGLSADHAPLGLEAAAPLGAFLRRLHRPAPSEAPFNRYRSIELKARAEITEPQLERIAAANDLIAPEAWRIWRDGVAASVDLPATWIHGDLHARNVLSDAGALSAVIDWGDMARGDAATDLAALWMLLPDLVARRAALAAYGGVSDMTLRRARGWAVAFGAMLVDAGAVNDPGLARMGERTFRALLDGP